MLLLAATMNALAQGSTIAYQGRLDDGGAPANTNYDFRFAVFNDLVATNNAYRASLWLTNYAVPVSNGLFAVTLNFGSGVFNGTANGSNDWMDISVRGPGSTNFTALSPRQPILPVPYAQFAISASNLLGSITATQIVGTISSALISGTYSNAVSFSNSTNSFAGNGAGLTSLNGSAVTSGTVADARLSSNVALLNQNQTFTGADTFTGTNLFTNTNTFTGTGNYTGVNTFTNWNNSFVGNFYGNGLVGWGAVAAASQQAVRDHGYMETNPLYTTITLPVSPLTNGDIVRVSGGGTGGWRVVVNNGQSIFGTLASFDNCFPVPVLSGASYTGVAASADGVRMFAVGNGSGIIYSPNSGNTWSSLTAATITGNKFYSIACSANGRIVYAEPITNISGSATYLQKSTDGGITWSTLTTTANGQAIACSANGTNLFIYNAASSGNGTCYAEVSYGTVYITTNSGVSGFAIAIPVAATCVGVSSDCTRLVVGGSPSLLYGSADQGAHWTALTTATQYWSGAWMSPDGTRFAASATINGGTDGGVVNSTITMHPNVLTTNGISGSQGSAVELQYLGNGQFMPVSSTGVIWAN